MNKKILSFLLVLSLAAALLAGCAGKTEKDQITGASSENVSDEFAEINSYVASLAASQGTYDGKTFTVIGSLSSIIADVQEETGNLENDALYKRQRELEDVFDIDIEYVESKGVESGYSSTGAETADRVNTDVLSNLGSYDLIYGNIMTCGQVMLNNGSISSVGDVVPLDFSQTWWLNDLESQFEIAGDLYFLTGKIVPNHYHDGACILYNKDVAENYAVADVYEIVRNGEWTFDKMMEVASAIGTNSDTYKVRIGGANGGLSIYCGGGFTVAQRDEEGNLSIPKALTNEQSDYIDKLAAVFGDTSSVMNTLLITDTESEYGYADEADAFIDGKILFSQSSMGDVSALREKDVEFGIIPIPKRNTDQKEYISYASAWMTGGVYFSKVLQDIEMTATVTEAMAALSAKYLEPAYYEKALKGRGTYDSDSREMLDLIYKTKVIDLADTYHWGDVVEIINDAVLAKNDSYVSSYAGATALANNVIKRLEKQIAANNK